MQLPLLLAVLAALAEASPTRPRPGPAPPADPVCIVGAGPAGLSAAKALEAKGLKTVIFEKRKTVGGKCQSYYDDLGNFHPLGAVLFTEATYSETVKVINSTGVSYEAFSTGEAWTFDWKAGFAALTPPLPQEVVQALGAEFQRYAAFWMTQFAPLTAIGYKNGIPPEFTVPAQQFLLANGFGTLSAVINEAMVTYGYGDYREVPLVYVMQFFTPDIVANSLRLVRSYKIDFYEVFKRLATTIKGPIHLDATIKDISRGDCPSITYRPSRALFPKVQKCSSVILAFPPTVPALKAAGVKLSKAERDLFSQVEVLNFYASAVNMPAFPPATSFWPLKATPITPVDAEGQPIYWTRLHPNSTIANVWSWDKASAPPDENKARKLLVETLSKFNKNPHDAVAVPLPVTKKDIKGFSGLVDYFPHLGSKALAEGWYGKLEALQGKDKTYFASGLNGFETVEFAIRAGYDIATYL